MGAAQGNYHCSIICAVCIYTEFKDNSLDCGKNHQCWHYCAGDYLPAGAAACVRAARAQKLVVGLFNFGEGREKGERFSSKTADEIVRAAYEMGAVRTGALIVIEQDMVLEEYVRTGIEVDGVVTSQLLINIFEHNTPLHDGAVIVRGNRVVAATCYLPLSDNSNLSKELGTRHRAGVGISEGTDSFTIIVSEETGAVSVAVGGSIIRDIDRDSLRNKLEYLRKKTVDVKSFKIWRGRLKNERKDI